MNCLVVKIEDKVEVVKSFEDLRDASEFISSLKKETTGIGEFGITSFENYHLISEDDEFWFEEIGAEITEEIKNFFKFLVMEKEFILIADGYYNNFYYLATHIHGIFLKSEAVKRKEEWLKILNLTEEQILIKN